MTPYLYTEKDGVHIFDLTKTKTLLDEALGVLHKAAKEGKTILFVGTKKQAKEKIKEVAEATGSFFVNERWLGGILTNIDQIKKSISKLTDIKIGFEKGIYKNYTKKERLLLDRELQRLIRFFGGLVGMQKLPDLLVIVDVKRERTAVKESVFTGVETIGIVDSNSDPDDLDYPVPMNDDAIKAVDYVLNLMKEAVLKGKGIKSDELQVTSDKKKVEKLKKEDKKSNTRQVTGDRKKSRKKV